MTRRKTPCCSRRQPPASAADDAPLKRDDLEALLTKEGERIGSHFTRWAKSHGISKYNAKDAIQETLADLIARIEDGKASKRHLDVPLLFVSAARRAFKNQRLSKAVLPADRTADRRSPRRHDPEVVYRAMHEALPIALEQLDERDWIRLTLCDAEGGKQKDAADLFGVTQGNISRWLTEARQRLRRRIVALLVRQGFDPSALP